MATAIITGGTGGLGTAIADELKRAGMEVQALSRKDVDVTDSAAVAQFFGALEPPDLLVCAAGITRDRLLSRLVETAWDEVMDVNLRGSFLCARAVALGMVKRRQGHIIFISSHSALHPPMGQAAYAAAKAGLLGLTRSLTKELGSRNVRVNAILPGFLETPMTVELHPEVLADALRTHALGRFNRPEEVAAFLRCLHFEMAGTSGQVFALDSRTA